MLPPSLHTQDFDQDVNNAIDTRELREVRDGRLLRQHPPLPPYKSTPRLEEHCLDFPATRLPMLLINAPPPRLTVLTSLHSAPHTLAGLGPYPP